MPKSFQVFGIKFIRDEFDSEDRYLSDDGNVTTNLSDAWFNLDLDHANWYAKYKSERNSAIDPNTFSFQVTEDGEPISE